MSKKRLFGSLATIELLFYLSSENFITSGIIRTQFNTVPYQTIYKRLTTLKNQGYVEEMEKSGDYAGDDRREYKVTESGLQFREEITENMVKLLQPAIDKMIQQKTKDLQTPILEDKEEQIKNFILEFSGECEGIINDETSVELQKILKRLLTKIFYCFFLRIIPE